MEKKKVCLICRRRNITFYGICPECKAMNEKMVSLTRDFTGYNCVVTGGRIKIGYATCLRLLRQGANVLAITRYPNVAMQEYQKENDYEVWKDRLHIVGFDLTYVNHLDELLEEIRRIFDGKVDILINNAAQTVRKSNEYYSNLIEMDKKLMIENSTNALVPITNEQHGIIELNQTVSYGETERDNSWIRKAGEVSLREMLEVQLINVTAPFALTTRIADLMMKHNPERRKWIINVSSVEGKFMEKPSRHTHTNMAKASLNMMTLSLKDEYKKRNIYIYSSDPGWVSNQFPPGYEFSQGFKPYLSYEDGACRVLYPIHSNITKDVIKNAGAFYKDYKIIDY